MAESQGMNSPCCKRKQAEKSKLDLAFEQLLLLCEKLHSVGVVLDEKRQRWSQCSERGSLSDISQALGELSHWTREKETLLETKVRPLARQIAGMYEAMRGAEEDPLLPDIEQEKEGTTHVSISDALIAALSGNFKDMLSLAPTIGNKDERQMKRRKRDLNKNGCAED